MNIIEKLNEDKKYFEDMYGLSLNKKQLNVLRNKNEIVEETFNRLEGCTTTACIKAIEFAINNSGSNVLVTTPFRHGSQISFNYTVNMLREESLNENLYRCISGDNIIDLINGSRIAFRSAHSLDNLRGCRFDCIIIEPLRSFSPDVINNIQIFNINSPIRQTVILNQTDFMNGQPINI